MCGIIGIFGDGIKTKQDLISPALASLKHRGPDEEGVWFSSDHRAVLGHTRLSIIDLPGGHQPLISPDGAIAAVVNGELYNYQSIRTELQEWGCSFKTDSDSEILLGLYARYGISCLEHMRGEFAFILWDKRNRWTFAARDRFGIKPLFYAIHEDKLCLASEVKALKELGVPMAWDPVQFYQAINMAPSIEGSLFQGVKQIAPGHYLVKSWDANDLHLQKYWDFNYPKGHERKNISEQEAVEGFQSLFKEAISLRLRADVPVACYLSGGLDSCSILGFTQELSPQTVHSFTLTFSHDEYNEAKQAEEMANFAGSPYHPIPISQKEIAENWDQAVLKAERFLFNGHGVAKYLLSRAVHNAGLKVVLTGEGSDEIFGGYAHFRQDEIIHGNQWYEHERKEILAELAARNKVSQGLLLGNSESEEQTQIIARLGYVPGWFKGFADQRQLSQKILSDDFLNQYQCRNPLLYLLTQFDFNQISDREKLDQSLYLWSKAVLPYYLLTVLGDRMEMAHSIEGRLPFLDHKVVEYVVNMPPQYKIKKLTEKYLLREAAKPFITKTIYERQKHPFLAPPSRAENQTPHMVDLIEDTLRSKSLGDIPFIDQSKVIKFLDQHMQSKEVNMSEDINLLNLVSAAFIQKGFGMVY
ncbi:MAG: asparagine synthase (glutamine-hydrolyzing) [Oligoflexales bacterium]